MKKLAFFSSIIFAIGCSNDNSSHDTSIVNSTCTYEGVELDTHKIVIISEQDLVGEWKLQSFVSLSDCSMKNEPVDIRKSIVVSFKDSLGVSGHTVNNDFWGIYRLITNKIEFIDLKITLIFEPEWGVKFLNAISYTDFIFIEDSMLFIFFNQSSEVLVFTKN